jgi:hypothetical protein
MGDHQLSLLDPSEWDIPLSEATRARIQATTDTLVLARLGDRAQRAGEVRVAEWADERRKELRRMPWGGAA